MAGLKRIELPRIYSLGSELTLFQGYTYHRFLNVKFLYWAISLVLPFQRKTLARRLSEITALKNVKLSGRNQTTQL